MAEWWQSFFDPDYLRLWEGTEAAERTDLEAAGLWTLLDLTAGSRVLDAPCGYGRVALALARRGARVLGVDASADMLAEAERRRADIPVERLRYVRADLRDWTAAGRSDAPAGPFDAALNIFTSLGYGTEADDLRMLSALRAAVRPGGRVFIETAHRDRVAVGLWQARQHGHRLADGTLMLETPQLDALTGRVESTWHWSGPLGSGTKRSSLRIYTVTEIAGLVAAAGLRLQSLHSGCSPDPFIAAGPTMSGRLGLLAVRD